ncbi:helix-turn-helix transcriptional regulator [Elizabethkingia anophelis]|uniref:Transcriptional regulator n=2 Tax=Elizabethkingia anophelis TaxID=1117645 RepID=A0AAP5RZR4_9FLAO|nr:helix-turn-helix transcriptional regulator [Elizabethkingia anophelis]AQW94155.1 transcriptional regulator [Elizabethkingia anophelis]AQX01082.1 transcriptional regulator [Elizabethkingia anophelis]KFC36248.1 transcriptional regulator [Elizabethkingia anophelis]MCL1033791.1 helix-turn-helix transcriptional regulator [Elizabethkingia anophelis]MCL1691227.1 helix-turn-helix transcriptional regulator [Elizabethkingia anophelis]
MDTVEKILNKIKEARKEYGYSHENMAHELGISQAAYTNLEKNESKLTVERFLTIAEILKKSPFSFFDDGEKNVYNQQNTEQSIGHQENFYKEDKEILEKLLFSYESRIAELKNEIDFLREQLKK